MVEPRTFIACCLRIIMAVRAVSAALYGDVRSDLVASGSNCDATFDSDVQLVNTTGPLAAIMIIMGCWLNAVHSVYGALGQPTTLAHGSDGSAQYHWYVLDPSDPVVRIQVTKVWAFNLLGVLRFITRAGQVMEYIPGSCGFGEVNFPDVLAPTPSHVLIVSRVLLLNREWRN